MPRGCVLIASNFLVIEPATQSTKLNAITLNVQLNTKSTVQRTETVGYISDVLKESAEFANNVTSYMYIITVCMINRTV